MFQFIEKVFVVVAVATAALWWLLWRLVGDGGGGDDGIAPYTSMTLKIIMILECMRRSW